MAQISILNPSFRPPPKRCAATWTLHRHARRTVRGIGKVGEGNQGKPEIIGMAQVGISEFTFGFGFLSELNRNARRNIAVALARGALILDLAFQPRVTVRGSFHSRKASRYQAAIWIDRHLVVLILIIHGDYALHIAHIFNCILECINVGYG